MKNDFNIDDFLQKSINEVEVQPRITSFDAVLKKLEQKKKRRFFIFFLFGIGFSLLAALPFLYHHSNAPIAEHVKQTRTSNRQLLNKRETEKPQAKLQVTSPSILVPSVPKDATDKSVNHRASNSVQLTSLKLAKQEITSFPHNESATLATSISSFTPAVNTVDTSSPKIVMTEQGIQVEPSDTMNVPLKNDSVLEPVQMAHTLTLTPQIIQVIDSQIPAKKRLRFLIGADFNPQYSSLLLVENKQRNARYDNSANGSFSKLYLQNRKDQNEFVLNYSYGLKFGLQLRDTWEVWLSGGIQRITYHEKLFYLSQTQSMTSVGLTGNGYVWGPSSVESDKGFKNYFFYRSYGLDVARIIRPNPFLKLKLGFGLTASNLFSTSSIFVKSPNVYLQNNTPSKQNLSRWTYTTHANVGVIKDLTKRLQYRVSPGLYYTPTSMFSKDYVIKQHGIGFELECLLIYKL